MFSNCEGSAWCLPRLPGIEASRPRPDTPARRVIRIIRIIRSYGHTAAWHCATLPRLPGIEASSAAPPDRVFFYHSHAHPSILAWAQDCPFNPGVGTGLPEKPITGPSPKVCQRCCKDGIADIVFFSPFTRPTVNPGVGTGLPHSILAWAQDCPLNPGVGTGLPHSILAWAQDCPGVSQKTLEVQCCTALRPQTRRPDCAENTGSASVHSDALPDSPPGLPGKLRQRPATQQDADGLAARLPGFKFGK